jgi:hypothetical protein
MAKEAEEKAKSDQDPANQARKSIDDLDSPVTARTGEREWGSN